LNKQESGSFLFSHTIFQAPIFFIDDSNQSNSSILRTEGYQNLFICVKYIRLLVGYAQIHKSPKLFALMPVVLNEE